MSNHKIDAISVFIQIDGQTCLAPIDQSNADFFLKMLSAFQTGSPPETKLIKLPKDVADKVAAVGTAIYEASMKAKETKNERLN